MTEPVITSAANPLVKFVRSLEMRKVRERESLFVAEGARHIGEALDAGFTVRTLLFQPEIERRPKAAELMAACAARGTRLAALSRDLMARVTHRDNAETLVGIIEQRWHPLSGVGTGPDSVWIGLEEVRDPGNLGTIIRTADAVGAEGVLLIGATCDPYSPEAVRASMGSIARVGLARVDQGGFLGWLNDWPGHAVGTHLAATTDFRAAPYPRPLLLLMGNEQAGLSGPVAAACGTLVKIPMRGSADSLNLAVATGVMLFEVMKDRLSPAP